MTDALATRGLSKRYGHRPALTDCTLSIPARQIAGLVGPNGAGKTTLLHLAVGMLAPTSGTIEVLGGRPGSGPAQLARVGFVAQESPLYDGFTVADHLRLGAHMNPGWDAALARDRIGELGLDPRQGAGQLSGGQLALTLALAKRPELLILDEPIASLDPLARNEFLRSLAGYTASRQVSVVMSSHLVSDLERICDYLIVLVASRVQLAGPITELLASHRQGLEDLVLDYMSRATIHRHPAPDIAAAAAAAVLALLLAVTGPYIVHLYDINGIATCTPGPNCQSVTNTFYSELPWFDAVLFLLGIGIMFAVPAVVDHSRDRGPHPPADLEPERHQVPVAGR